MKKLFCCFVFIISMPVFGQHSIVIMVNDAISQRPIEFPWIRTNNGKVEYGDKNGLIAIDRKNLHSQATISCIGYEPETLNLKNTMNDTAVFLVPANYELPNITVKAKGNPKFCSVKTQGRLNATFSTNGKTIYVSEVQKPVLKESYLKSVTFRFNTRKYFSNVNLIEDVLLRLHIYEKEKTTGLPGKLMLQENIVFKVNKEFTGEKKLNIFNKLLRITDDNFFIGFEYIGLTNQTSRELKPFNIQCQNNKSGRILMKELFGSKWIALPDLNLYIEAEFEEL